MRQPAKTRDNSHSLAADQEPHESPLDRWFGAQRPVQIEKCRRAPAPVHVPARQIRSGAHRAAPIGTVTRTVTRGRSATGRTFGAPASSTALQNRRPSHKTGAARNKQKITVAPTIPLAHPCNAGSHAAIAAELTTCAQLTSIPSTTKHKHFKLA